jgi:hypothetical protein
MKVFLWGGPVLVASVVVGMVPLLGFIPPPSATLSAEEVAAIYSESQTSIRVGCLMLMICWTLWGTWGAVIATLIKRMEAGYPLLTYSSVALLGAGVVFFLLIPMTWAVAAFRPGEIDPSITMTLNDWAWFSFMYSWPPFAICCIILAIAILRDHNVPTIYPRWAAYLNLWFAVLFTPAGLMSFFKTGPFALDGVGTFFIPVSLFFIWMLVMSWLTNTAIVNENKRLLAWRATWQAPVPAVERELAGLALDGTDA